MPIKLEVWGEYACFTRPELKAERVSYDVMTPSAARGILEAIYWKPEIRWVVDEIHVLAPIKWMSIRRNEVAGKASPGNPIYIEDQRQQRSTLLLRNVRYGIVAHFALLPSHDPKLDKVDNTATKHLEIFTRRAVKGQHFHQPYLGCREFAANYRLATDGFSPSRLLVSQRDRDLGQMFYDMAWPDQRANFFHAELIDGIIKMPSRSNTMLCGLKQWAAR
jgi:CRISPR-associated protein Cas5d